MPEEIKKKKRVKHRLPKELIVIHNKDKQNDEKWKEHRDPLDFPAPSRILLLGKPGSGKTLCMFNIILRAKIPYDQIYLVHCDIEGTCEFDDLDVMKLDEIPHMSEFEREGKKLIILEDLEYGNLSKDQRARLDRLYGYASSHKKLTIMASSQDGFALPPIVRRCTQVFIIWRVTDTDSLNCIGRRCGFKGKHFTALFKKFIHKPTDSLWIDLTNNSPYPLRINAYKMVKLIEDDKKNIDIAEV
jgi:hypothetical protein